MILSYNIEGNSDDSENENCESTTKSIHNHTESSGVNSRHSRSSSAPKQSSSNLNKLYDSKLFDEIFNDSEADYENKSSLKDKKLSSDDILSFKEEHFLQKDIINLLDSSLKIQNTTNPSFSKESLKYKNYFNDSNDSSNINTAHNLANQKASTLEQRKHYDVSFDKSIISNISHNSRNYIPKIVPNCSQEINELNANNEELNNSQLNIEKFKDDLGKSNAISYYNIFNVTSKEVTINLTEDLDEKIKNKERTSPEDETKRPLANSSLFNLSPTTINIYPPSYENPIGNQGDYPSPINNDPRLDYLSHKMENNSNRPDLINFNAYDESKLYIPRNLTRMNSNGEKKSPKQFSFGNSPYSQHENVYIENFTSYLMKDNKEIHPNTEMNYTSLRNRNENIKTYPKNYIEMNDEELSKYSHLISKEQAGCRFLQKRIDDNPDIVNKYIYDNIFKQFILLMKDSFANYFVQKVVEHLSQDKLDQIVNLITPEFMQLGLSPYGTRVIQKIIEVNKSEKTLTKLSDLINPNILIFMKDPNANHILLKFVTVIPFPQNQFIYDAICNNIVTVSSQKHSCCALQKCIDAGNKLQKEKIFKVVAENTYILITDPFGNYVLQYIITHGNIEINYRISLVFVTNIFYLSKQKFSSNVIEKCFDYCDEKTKFSIVKSLCETNQIPELLLDMYGNYVLQKALSNAQEPYLSYMISSIAPHLEKLKFHAFGPKLYNKLISTYPKLTMLKDTQMNQKILNNHRQMNSISSNNLINVTDNNFNPYNRMMPTMSNAIINQMNCYATPMTNNNMFNNNVIYQNIPYDQYSNYPPNFNFPSYYHK